MIKESKFKSDLLELIKRDTSYRALYPYNLLYYDGTKWIADCVNLLKALFNGRNIYDYTVGGFQRDLSLTGDCNEWELLQQCTDISKTFTDLGSHCRVLYMSGHIGCYVGEFDFNGKVYNTVECTWGNLGKGTLPSYVGSNGERLAYKGSPINQGYWTYSGSPTKWIELESNEITYSEEQFYRAIENDIDISKSNAKEFPHVTEYMRRYLYFYHYVKVINKKWTNALTRKLKKWQKDQGLPVTGHLRGDDLERMRDR